MIEQKTQTAEIQDQNTAPPKRKRTAGERIFDRTVYTGIGFGVNEVSSLWITDQFMHGKNLLARIPGLKKAGAWLSKEGFDRASEAIAKTFKLTEKLAKDGSKILPKERAGNSILMATLLSGGTLLTLPMKWLEDHKIYWVKKANHMADRLRGTKLTQDEVDARDSMVETAIACSPRQSWPSMLIGRAVAMFASWGTGTFLVGPERNNKLMNWAEETFTGSLQPPKQQNALHRYARLSSVETYSCAVSSAVLEASCKLSAKKMLKRHDPELCDTAVDTPFAGTDGKTISAAESHATRIQSQKDRVTSLAK